MSCTNAESRTSEVGGIQVGNPISSEDDPNRVETFKAESTGSRGFPAGISGADSAKLYTLVLLTGGILSQLIDETRDRLGEMRECVSWYQNQVAKYEQRLAELELLQSTGIEPEVEPEESGTE